MDQFKNELGKRAHLFVWTFLIFILAAALFLATLFIAEMKNIKYIGQDIEFRNTITITGKGEATAVPDTSEFSFAVVEEAGTAAKAQEAVTKKMNEIIEYLKGSGLNEKDIKTTNYTINPRYEYERGTAGTEYYYPIPEGKRNLAGYEVSHWVTIKIRTLDDVGEIVAQVGQLGATNISQVAFTIEDEDAIIAEARKRAIEDAKAKAKELARNLDVRLVKVVSFSEGWGGPIYYRAEAAIKGGGYGGDNILAPEIPAGENTVTSHVTIVYAIR